MRPSLSAVSRFFWAAVVVALLAVVYTALQVAYVQPYLWPAGHGAVMAGDSRFAGGSGDRRAMLARPPAITDHAVGATIVLRVRPGSPAAAAGLRAGDDILSQRRLPDGPPLDLTPLMTADAGGQLALWRQAYATGLHGPLELTVQRIEAGRTLTKTLVVDRPAVWRLRDVFGEWAPRHLGLLAQIVVFIGCAVTLLVLRATDVTAALAVLALILCAVAAGGPLLGSEQHLPRGLRGILTVFAWTASPMAFPLTGLAMLYFPRKSALLVDRPWVHVVPFAAAAPMLFMSAGTALYLAGFDAAREVAVWDTAHANVFYSSFAVALGFNVLATVHGVWRFRHTIDPNEQRRIRLAVWTLVPGVIAYVIKDGVPAVSLLLGRGPVDLPGWMLALLYGLVMLPGFGLAYAVAVHRVLGPRMVVRRSIQYALATRTLTTIALLPAIALVWSLARDKEMPLSQIVSGAPAFYAILIALSVAAFRYRDRARVWLDQRFFRHEYDARKILLSLASRVRFETDPSDLSTLVLNQIDQAIHPEMSAILVSGIDEGRVTPVAVLHGSADSLPLAGGLVTMLRWSDEPLELDLADPRSAAHRLPADEQEWLECTAAVLLVPIIGDDRALVGIIALGGKRSEEPYTAEDRQLLASIAAQMGLGFDVARLRQRVASSHTAGAGATGAAAATKIQAPAALMVECPRCGRCEDADVTLCPDEGTAMKPVAAVPRIIDRKYRLDRVIGRGGMGAVYRAHDMRLDRDVAIKMVRADLLSDADSRRRFRREAQIVAKLQHPAIVSVFDYGTLDDGSAFLVMEFIRGESLRQAIQRERRLPTERAVRIMTGTAGGVAAAHGQGVLHRDLKPENIVLSGGDAEVKVLDFGVATFFGEARRSAGAAATMITLAGTIVGTPAYMAPEQLRDGVLGPHTDVFALGVIAYELLTGELPFGSGSFTDVVLAQANGAPPLARADLQLPSGVERAVLAALHADPAARPSTPLAFVEQLRHA